MEKRNEEGRVLLVNKPYRWTSFAVVNKLKYKLRIRKIGHAGTLDPLATGLLIICMGKMTKNIADYMGMEKEYTGKFILGQSTASHDLETQLSEQQDTSHISSERVYEIVKTFQGKILQLPPLHSAIRVGGRRAYEFARKGQAIELASREVEVSEFEITDTNLPEVTFRIVCSKGTYIRSLVRDIGQALGVGAHLSELCRTRIGTFHLKDAQTIEEVNT